MNEFLNQEIQHSIFGNLKCFVFFRCPLIYEKKNKLFNPTVATSVWDKSMDKSKNKSWVELIEEEENGLIGEENEATDMCAYGGKSIKEEPEDDNKEKIKKELDDFQNVLIKKEKEDEVVSNNHQLSHVCIKQENGETAETKLTVKIKQEKKEDGDEGEIRETLPEKCIKQEDIKLEITEIKQEVLDDETADSPECKYDFWNEYSDSNDMEFKQEEGKRKRARDIMNEDMQR